MKKSILAVFTILSLSNSYSQEKEIKQTIKFNAISVFNHVYDLQYEKVLNDKNSVQFGVGFGNNESTDADKARKIQEDNFSSYTTSHDVLITEKTFTLNVDYRHYYMKSTTAPKGLYISPSVQYLKSDNSLTIFNSNGAADKFTQKLNLINARFLVGAQITIAKVVCLNPYFGPSYAFGTAKAYDGKEDSKAKGLLFNFGVYLGIAL